MILSYWFQTIFSEKLNWNWNLDLFEQYKATGISETIMQPIMFQILFIMSGQFYQYFQYKQITKAGGWVCLIVSSLSSRNRHFLRLSCPTCPPSLCTGHASWSHHHALRVLPEDHCGNLDPECHMLVAVRVVNTGQSVWQWPMSDLSNIGVNDDQLNLIYKCDSLRKVVFKYPVGLTRDRTWNACSSHLPSLPASHAEAAQDFPDEKPKATSSDAEKKRKKPAGRKRSHKWSFKMAEHFWRF